MQLWISQVRTALRRYMEGLPPEQSGWLAAARDPVVGAALALMHRKAFEEFAP